MVFRLVQKRGYFFHTQDVAIGGEEVAPIPTAAYRELRFIVAIMLDMTKT